MKIYKYFFQAIIIGKNQKLEVVIILNLKEIEIFNIFISSDEVNINELAGKFYVTERSIRYNIEKINQVLDTMEVLTLSLHFLFIFQKIKLHFPLFQTEVI